MKLESNDKATLLHVISDVIQATTNGKIIIYCWTIDFGSQIANYLKVPFFHSRVGNSTYKEHMLEEFSSNGKIIVATNAMGLGIDIPDIRLVLHAGSPRSILNFVQESGRAGRDGSTSRSVLLHLPMNKIDNEMRSYVETGKCRRYILDKVMDGTDRDLKCNLLTEAACDHCLRTRNAEMNHLFYDQNGKHSPEAPHEDIKEFEDLSDIALFEACEPIIKQSLTTAATTVTPTNPKITYNTNKRPYNAILPPNKQTHLDFRRKSSDEDHIEDQLCREELSRKQFRQNQQDIEKEIQLCTDMMDAFYLKKGSNLYPKCILCVLTKASSCTQQHKNQLKSVKIKREEAVTAIKNTYKLPRFAGCFFPGCYIPQSYCSSWKDDGNGGFIRSDPSTFSCRRRYLLLDVIYTLKIISQDSQMLLERMQKENNCTDELSMFTKKMKWNGMEANGLFVAFCTLSLYSILCQEKNCK